ncbi:MAG: prolipoprotein diacylglyceryl transferase [Clostridia bacterium]|nr:prolipoprotein diacylglyceryl transferase [Clostridia bacterium]
MYQEPIFGLFTLYGLSIAIGVLGAVLVLFIFAKGRIKESFIDFLFYNGVVAIALGFGAATLFQSFYNFLDNPAGGWKWGGMTFMGGLLGGVVTFLAGYFIFRKRLEGRLVDIITLLPCCIVIAHAFGRIGCFFAGCCYGKPTDSFLGVKFPFLDHKVHPTQLYEAAFLFILFAVMLLLYLKKDFKHNLSLYLLAYGVFRFLIEYVRGDERGSFVAGISPSQFWAIVMIVASVAVYFLLEYAYKKRAEELASQTAGDVTPEISVQGDADETALQDVPVCQDSQVEENVGEIDGDGQE